MKLLIGLVLSVFVLAPVGAIVEASTFQALWSWFAASQYGSGPSLGAWFGVAVIFGVALNIALVNVPREKNDPTKILLELVTRNVEIWIGCACVLASSWITGHLLGWV